MIYILYNFLDGRWHTVVPSSYILSNVQLALLKYHQDANIKTRSPIWKIEGVDELTDEVYETYDYDLSTGEAVLALKLAI